MCSSRSTPTEVLLRRHAAHTHVEALLLWHILLLLWHTHVEALLLWHILLLLWHTHVEARLQPLDPDRGAPAADRANPETTDPAH